MDIFFKIINNIMFIIIATIELLYIINKTDGEILGIWTVTDKFNAKDFRISYSFPDVIISVFLKTFYDHAYLGGETNCYDRCRKL